MENKETYKCYICDCIVTKELMITSNDDIVMGLFAIMLRNAQAVVCSQCFSQWNKMLELLLSRFKEQHYIDEDICKKILEYKDAI